MHKLKFAATLFLPIIIKSQIYKLRINSNFLIFSRDAESKCWTSPYPPSLHNPELLGRATFREPLSTGFRMNSLRRSGRLEQATKRRIVFSNPLPFLYHPSWPIKYGNTISRTVNITTKNQKASIILNRANFFKSTWRWTRSCSHFPDAALRAQIAFGEKKEQ